MVIDMSKWMQGNFLYIVGILVASFMAFRAFYRSPIGTVTVDGIMLKSPVFGELLTRVAVARFCRTMGTMIASGVPILEAMEN